MSADTPALENPAPTVALESATLRRVLDDLKLSITLADANGLFPVILKFHDSTLTGMSRTGDSLTVSEATLPVDGVPHAALALTGDAVKALVERLRRHERSLAEVRATPQGADAYRIDIGGDDAPIFAGYGGGVAQQYSAALAACDGMTEVFEISPELCLAAMRTQHRAYGVTPVVGLRVEEDPYLMELRTPGAPRGVLFSMVAHSYRAGFHELFYAQPLSALLKHAKGAWLRVRADPGGVMLVAYADRDDFRHITARLSESVWRTYGEATWGGDA